MRYVSDLAAGFHKRILGKKLKMSEEQAMNWAQIEKRRA